MVRLETPYEMSFRVLDKKMRQNKHGLRNYDENDQALLYPHDALDFPICHSDCWRSVPETSRKIKRRVPNHPKQEPGWLYLNRVSFPASGVLLIAACFGYLADSLTPLLLPSYAQPITEMQSINGDKAAAFWANRRLLGSYHSIMTVRRPSTQDSLD